MLNIKLLTIFPEIFPGPLAHSLAGKALDKKLFLIESINLRNYSNDKNQTVDDRVFGGGAGMLLKADVVGAAIDSCLKQNPDSVLIYFSPRGNKFDQRMAQNITSNTKNLIILCGRYEGVDQRIFEKYNFIEISIGDYILSGGEIAALTFIDVCLRLLPGVISNPEVNKEESFAENESGKLLEYDQYTRPAVWQGLEVPKVLLSGNHKDIADWRLKNSILRTSERRPDLLSSSSGVKESQI